MDIGEKIKRIRLNRKFKQSDLAEKSGISRVAIGNYERGDRHPNIEMLSKIADTLDVTINEILEIDEPVNALHSYSTDELLEELRRRLM